MFTSQPVIMNFRISYNCKLHYMHAALMQLSMRRATNHLMHLAWWNAHWASHNHLDDQAIDRDWEIKNMKLGIFTNAYSFKNCSFFHFSSFFFFSSFVRCSFSFALNWISIISNRSNRCAYCAMRKNCSKIANVPEKIFLPRYFFVSFFLCAIGCIHLVCVCVYAINYESTYKQCASNVSLWCAARELEVELHQVCQAKRKSQRKHK